MGDIEKLAGSVASLQASFEEHRYICSDEIATAVFLAYQLRKPILIEGPPGVGKNRTRENRSGDVRAATDSFAVLRGAG